MKPNKLNVPLITAIVSLLISVNAFAQDLLVDRNGDGVIRVTAFGDSITYGVGDGTSPGAFVEVAPFTDGNIGYPPRVQALGGIEIFNQGDPGESLAVGGILRFPAVLQSTSPDVVVIFEGSNDVLQDTAPEFGRNLQKAINVANALGITPVVSTLPPECCDRGGRTPLVRQFNQRIRAVVAENELSLIDLERAWDSTCSGPECQLYNVPEGLHPNSLG
ncbi:MAG: SGNH/GDSL hydrolase family protein, partial [Bdellovibrionales bacterium]|nr:SGNH/GDSL hydrolase family protein [Bdellovibrionales bacterium]